MGDVVDLTRDDVEPRRRARQHPRPSSDKFPDSSWTLLGSPKHFYEAALDFLFAQRDHGHWWCRHTSLMTAFFPLAGSPEMAEVEILAHDQLGKCGRCASNYTLMRDRFFEGVDLKGVDRCLELTSLRNQVATELEALYNKVLDADIRRLSASIHSAESEVSAVSVFEALVSLRTLFWRNNFMFTLLNSESSRFLSKKVRRLCLEGAWPVGLVALAVSATGNCSMWAKGCMLPVFNSEESSSAANCLHKFCRDWQHSQKCKMPEIRRYFRKTAVYTGFADLAQAFGSQVISLWIAQHDVFLEYLVNRSGAAKVQAAETAAILSLLKGLWEIDSHGVGVQSKGQDRCLGQQAVDNGFALLARDRNKETVTAVSQLNVVVIRKIHCPDIQLKAIINQCVVEYAALVESLQRGRGDIRSFAHGPVGDSPKISSLVRLACVKLVSAVYELQHAGETREIESHDWVNLLFKLMQDAEYEDECMKLLRLVIWTETAAVFRCFAVVLSKEWKDLGITGSGSAYDQPNWTPSFWDQLLFHFDKGWLRSVYQTKYSNALIAGYEKIAALEHNSNVHQTSNKALKRMHETFGRYFRQAAKLAPGSQFNSKDWKSLLSKNFATAMCCGELEARTSAFGLLRVLYGLDHSNASKLCETLALQPQNTRCEVFRSLASLTRQALCIGVQHCGSATGSILFCLLRLADAYAANGIIDNVVHSVPECFRDLSMLAVVTLKLASARDADKSLKDLRLRSFEVLPVLFRSTGSIASIQTLKSETFNLLLSVPLNDDLLKARRRTVVSELVKMDALGDTPEQVNETLQSLARPLEGFEDRRNVYDECIAAAKKKFGNDFSVPAWCSTPAKDVSQRGLTKIEKMRQEYIERRQKEREEENQKPGETVLMDKVVLATPNAKDKHVLTQKIQSAPTRKPLDDLYSFILQLDPGKIADGKVSLPKNMRRTAVFQNAVEYAKYFEPLVWLEVASQIGKSMDELASQPEEPFPVSVARVPQKQSDGLYGIVVTEIRQEAPQSTARLSGFVETDLVLVRSLEKDSSPNKDSETLARVESNRWENRERLMTLVVSISGRLRLPAPGAIWVVVRVTNMATYHRQLTALWSLGRADRGIARMTLNPLERHTCSVKTSMHTARLESSEDYERLNHSQQRAITTVLRSRAPFTLIQGPPGTGKTTTILTLISVLLSCNVTGQSGSAKKTRILVAAPSNAAVDEIQNRFTREGVHVVGFDGKCCPPCVRVGVGSNDPESGSIGLYTLAKSAPTRSKYSETMEKLEAVRLKLTILIREIGALEKQLTSETGSDLDNVSTKLHCLRSEKSNLMARREKLQFKLKTTRSSDEDSRQEAQAEVLDRARVVFATLSSCGLDSMKNSHKAFNFVVIDEAVQSVEPEILIPLTAFSHNAARCVLVGDPRQLAATILSNNPVSKDVYSCSLFERMEVGPTRAVMLEKQYRMHPMISLFPSTTFYNSRLKDSHNVTASEYNKIYHRDGGGRYGPLTLYDTSGGIAGESRSADRSLRNVFEADVVLAVLESLFGGYGATNEVGSVAVVCPYRTQMRDIQGRISTSSCLRQRVILVTTVDGVQGREVDIVVLSTVRGSSMTDFGGIGFVADIRRMNVAITRPKFGLLVVGNGRRLASSSATWSQFIDYCRTKGQAIPIRHRGDLERTFAVSQSMRASMAIPTDNVLDSDSEEDKSVSCSVSDGEEAKVQVLSADPDNEGAKKRPAPPSRAKGKRQVDASTYNGITAPKPVSLLRSHPPSIGRGDQRRRPAAEEIGRVDLPSRTNAGRGKAQARPLRQSHTNMQASGRRETGAVNRNPFQSSSGPGSSGVMLAGSVGLQGAERLAGAASRGQKRPAQGSSVKDYEKSILSGAEKRVGKRDPQTDRMAWKTRNQKRPRKE